MFTMIVLLIVSFISCLVGFISSAVFLTVYYRNQAAKKEPEPEKKLAFGKYVEVYGDFSSTSPYLGIAMLISPDLERPTHDNCRWHCIWIEPEDNSGAYQGKLADLAVYPQDIIKYVPKEDSR